MEKELAEMQAASVICLSTTPYHGHCYEGWIPPFLCQLSKAECPNQTHYVPPPWVEDALNCLLSTHIFAILDFISDFWQLKFQDKDIEKIAFTCPDRLHEFLHMPFGLCNAPMTL